VTQHNGALHLSLNDATSPQDVLGQLMRRSTVERFEIAVPTLDEIFIRAVSEEAA
jgi:ABC-type uncharacterized transport system ATPase subunit